MKKLWLAIAMINLGLGSAYAAPTLYGKINVSLDYVKNPGFDGSNVTELNSNASRIGVKGEEALTDNLSAVYMAEWAVATDGKDGKSDTDLSMRNRYLGLKIKDIGTIKIGAYDSYLKTAAGSAQDIFNDHTRLDMGKILSGEDRVSNVIGFETDPKLLGGVQFNIMARQGEKAGDKDEKGLASGLSASLGYNNKDVGLNVALAANHHIDSKWNGIDGKARSTDAYRLTAAYDFSKAGIDGLGIGALAQHAKEVDGSAKEKAYGVALTYAISGTPVKVKGEYITAKTTANGMDDRTAKEYGIGMDYSLNKKTRLYAHLAQQQKDWLKDKQSVIGVGAEYNF